MNRLPNHNKYMREKKVAHAPFNLIHYLELSVTSNVFKSTLKIT